MLTYKALNWGLRRVGRGGGGLHIRRCRTACAARERRGLAPSSRLARRHVLVDALLRDFCGPETSVNPFFRAKRGRESGGGIVGGLDDATRTAPVGTRVAEDIALLVDIAGIDSGLGGGRDAVKLHHWAKIFRGEWDRAETKTYAWADAGGLRNDLGEGGGDLKAHETHRHGGDIHGLRQKKSKKLAGKRGSS